MAPPLWRLVCQPFFAARTRDACDCVDFDEDFEDDLDEADFEEADLVEEDDLDFAAAFPPLLPPSFEGSVLETFLPAPPVSLFTVAQPIWAARFAE